MVLKYNYTIDCNCDVEGCSEGGAFKNGEAHQFKTIPFQVPEEDFLRSAVMCPKHLEEFLNVLEKFGLGKEKIRYSLE